MAGYSKVVIMKSLQEDSGQLIRTPSAIFRVEEDDTMKDFFSLKLSIINLTPSDEEIFLALLFNDKKPLLYPVKKGRSDFNKTIDAPLDFKNGFCVGLICVKCDIPTTILYSQTENSKFNLSDFKSAMAEYCYKNRKKCQDCHPNDKTQSTPTCYDDEAVATIDYYALDKQIEQKLKTVKERNDESISTKNESSYNQSENFKEEVATSTSFNQNETIGCECQESKQTRPYHLTVKEQLDKLFERFHSDVGLNGFFPKSKWAKIPYSKDKFYVVGKVYERGDLRYICYGVPSIYSPTPPQELKGYCTFIPLSVFDMKGQGFWMMFQDAFSGKCKKIDC